MGSLMRTQTLFFCLLVIIYVCAIHVSGNPSEECKAEIHNFYKMHHKNASCSSDPEDASCSSDPEIEENPKAYFFYSIYSLRASFFYTRNYNDKQSDVGKYYGALYQSVQKHISDLNLKTPKNICKEFADGTRKTDTIQDIFPALFMLLTSETKDGTIPTVLLKTYDECLKAISTLEVNRLVMKDHNQVKAEEVFYNMYFSQTSDELSTIDPFTNALLIDYMTYFYDTLWNELDEELFLKVEDFCANPEKYPVLNAWSYEYTENEIDK